MWIEDEVYLPNIPGAPITAVIACAAAEAKALREIKTLIPEHEEAPCPIMVRWS
jgi:hypothetical protein